MASFSSLVSKISAIPPVEIPIYYFVVIVAKKKIKDIFEFKNEINE